MNQRARLFSATLAVAACVLLGLAARDALSPTAWMGHWLRERFSLNTRTAALGPVVVERVQKLGRLETSRFNEQVVVRGDHRNVLPVWLAGDRLHFLARGEVVAGVDLSRLSSQDVTTEGDRVSIRLPRSEVFHTALDNRRSEVIDRRSGFFTGPNRHLETKVRIEAEERLRVAALEGGILATADQNAQEALRNQLSLLGFREVRFL